MPSAPSSTEACWARLVGPQLAQGDYLPNCDVPVFPADYGKMPGQMYEVPTKSGDLIIMTHSCDLENNKISLAALCPIRTIIEMKAFDEKYGKADRLEEIRKGRFESLYMLSSPNNPDSNQDVRIVDFREIYSLPIAYLAEHAKTMGPRWRLKSPYLEHFPQAFARFFMRVGLPSTIQSFTGKKQPQ